MRLILSALVTFFWLTTSLTWAVDASSAVEETLGQILPKTSDPEALSRNFQEPLLTDIPLTTIDGSKSGPAKVACPGTKTVFQVLIQPSSTKDLQFVSVAYDTDYDGELDHDLDVTVPVSGVCANGFVSCTPGTWQDCHWYAWKFEGGILSYEEVSPSSLGGCYCINVGCTEAPFVTMKNQILRDLGGGIAGAMASEDPKLAVSEAEIEDLVIRYYGETSGECTIPDSYTAFGSSTPESVFENPAQLDILKGQELANEMSDPESYYSLITTSSAFTNASTQTCTLNRSVYFDGTSCQIVDQVSDGCKGFEEDPNCILKEETVYDVNGNPITTYKNFNPTGVMPVTTCVHFDPSTFSDCVANCKGNLSTDGGCTDICYLGLVSSIQYLGDGLWKVGLMPNGSNGCGDVFDYQVCGKFDGSWSIADDPCVSVTLDGENVISPFCYHSDGPTPSSGTFSGTSGSSKGHLRVSLNNLGKCNGWAHGSLFVYMKLDIPSSVCHEWWKIERIYVCTDKPLPEPDLSRADAVAESLTQSSSSWTYEDPAYGTGEIEFESKVGESCIKACKLRIVERRAQASAPYTTADYRHDPWSQYFVYRTCIDGACPVKEGEEIVEDCKCVEEFGLAYGVLESLRQASIDMTCSDGIPKP